MSENSDPASEIHRTVVDGVPVFWATGPAQLVGALMFRVGRSDEPLASGGLTHFVEHLALHGLGGQQTYFYNAQVDALSVVFFAVGTPDELVAYFRHVCGALHALPLERIQDEARVLRTEGVGRTPGVYEWDLWFRYGAIGHGTLCYPEFALHRLEPAKLTSWVAEHFTSGNAAAWFTGPIPAGLEFDLPDGPRRPVPEPRPLGNLVLPAWATGPPGFVSVSFVASRTDWAYIPARIAARRIEKRLRFDKALIYECTLVYAPIARDTAHTLLVARALEPHAKAVLDDMLEVLHTLAAEGPTEAELREVAAEWKRDAGQPGALEGQIQGKVFNELLGYPSRSLEELHQEILAMTPASAARVLRQGLESALLLVPNGAPCTNAAYRLYPRTSLKPVTGRTHRSVKTPFPWSKYQLRLIVGDDGVSAVDAHGNSDTVLYSELAAAADHPERGLELIGLDGYHIIVVPALWRDGDRALARIRSSIPAGRLVRLVD